MSPAFQIQFICFLIFDLTYQETMFRPDSWSYCIPWSSNSRCRCFTHLDQELKWLAWLPSFSSLELLVNSHVLDRGDIEKLAVLYLPNLFPIKYIIHCSGTNFYFVCHDNNCWTLTVFTWDQKLCLTTHDFALRFFASILFFLFLSFS